MLNLINGNIVEEPQEATASQINAMKTSSQCCEYSSSLSQSNSFGGQSLGGYTIGISSPNPYYWHSYPVYIYTDKTAKSIEILKQLEAEKLISVESVPLFIKLVEKISEIL